MCDFQAARVERAGGEDRQHPVRFGQFSDRYQESWCFRDVAAIEHHEKRRKCERRKQPAPVLRAGEQAEDDETEGWRKEVAKATGPDVDEARGGPAESRRTELGQHRDGGRNFAAYTESDDGAGHAERAETRCQRTCERADGEQQEIDAEHDPAPVAVADRTGCEPSDGGGAERDGVEKADIRRRQPPLRAKRRACDADGVLLETVEQAAEQDERNDVLVRLGDADLLERRLELLHRRRRL